MKKIKTLNIIAIVLVVYQILSYLGSLDNEKRIFKSNAEFYGYYLGVNLPIIISVVLFIIAASLKKKLRQKRENDIIDSIGKSE